MVRRVWLDHFRSLLSLSVPCEQIPECYGQLLEVGSIGKPFKQVSMAAQLLKGPQACSQIEFGGRSTVTRSFYVVILEFRLGLVTPILLAHLHAPPWSTKVSWDDVTWPTDEASLQTVKLWSLPQYLSSLPTHFPGHAGQSDPGEHRELSWGRSKNPPM